jgi:ParB-like chromosome segregation protein Spo0J
MSLEFIHPDLRSLAVPIELLHEDSHNANDHNDASYKAIAASFIEFGQRKNLVVRREGMILEAGNGSLRALRDAGWTHLACIVCDDDEQRATAYGLADNQAARHSSWNFDQLRANVEETLESYGEVFGQMWTGDELTNILTEQVVAHVELGHAQNLYHH